MSGWVSCKSGWEGDRRGKIGIVEEALNSVGGSRRASWRVADGGYLFFVELDSYAIASLYRTLPFSFTWPTYGEVECRGR